MENHTQLLTWIVGIMIVLGGAILGIMGKLIKGKKSSDECDLIHESVSRRLTDIKEKLDKGQDKMDDMKETLIEISTTLKVRSKDETDRYDRHTEGWKDK